MGDETAQMGHEGERLAEEFLKKAGFKTLARRYAAPVGELDLVMREKDTVVFVEVKTRRDRRLAEPEDAVHAGKQRKLVKTARWFLNQRQLHAVPCRFDVVTVLLPLNGPPEIRHFPEAFLPRD